MFFESAPSPSQKSHGCNLEFLHPPSVHNFFINPDSSDYTGPLVSLEFQRICFTFLGSLIISVCSRSTMWLSRAAVALHATKISAPG